jgi:hypothetical protein
MTQFIQKRLVSIPFFYLSVLVTFMTVVLLTSCDARASAAASLHPKGHFAAGIVIGEPTGLTGKYMLESDRALDFGLAWSFQNFFLFWMDHVWEWPALFGQSSDFVRRLTPYLGVGGVMLISTRTGNTVFGSAAGSSVGVGVRIPFGLEYIFAKVPIGIYLEVAPGIGIIPGTYGFLFGGIGARYYF